MNIYLIIGISIFSIVGLLLGAIGTLVYLEGDDRVAHKAKKLRNINISLLGMNGLLYRIHIIIIQSIFFWVITGTWKWSIGCSLTWNILNMILYYNWHYWFARMFILGKSNESYGE